MNESDSPFPEQHNPPEPKSPEEKPRIEPEPVISDLTPVETKADKPPTRVPDMVKTDLAELTRLLAENPALGDQIRELFERNLMQDQLSRETYERLIVSLQVLLGASASRIVVEATKILTGDFFTELRNSGDIHMEGTTRFLQHLAALYGTHMKDAFLLSFKYTDEDWRTAEVVAYQKADSDIWFIEFDLMKYNGERLFLRMSPVSAVQLLQTFMNEMGKLPQESIEEQTLVRIRETAAQFKKKYDPEKGDSLESQAQHQLDGYA